MLNAPKTKPFYIAILISAMAMGLLWFYFDFLIVFKENIGYFEEVQNGGGLGGLSVFLDDHSDELKFWYSGGFFELEIHPLLNFTLHWTLVPVLVPPIAFTMALTSHARQNLGVSISRSRALWYTAYSTLFWLICFYLIVSGVVDQGSPFHNRIWFLPIMIILGVELLISFYGRHYPGLRSYFSNSKVFIWMILGAVVTLAFGFFVTPSFLRNTLEDTLGRRFSLFGIQVFASIVFVVLWQAAFTVEVLRAQEHENPADKLEDIGRL